MTSKSSSYPLLSTILLMLATTELSARYQGQRRFELEEFQSIVLPESVAVSGVSVSLEGRFIAWSTKGRCLLVVEPQALSYRSIACESIDKPIAARFVTESTIEVLTQAMILRVQWEGHVASTVDFKAPVRVETAAYSRGAWHVGGPRQDAAGIDSIYQVWRLPGGDESLSQSPVRESFSPFRITGFNQSLLITNVAAPFANTLMAEDGSVRLAFHPIPDSVLSGSPGTNVPETVVSLPTLFLGDMYLQTISDLRSDRRTLILYDKQGNLLRSFSFDVAIGFAATRPSSNTLVAVRRTDHLELVGYRWRWTE